MRFLTFSFVLLAVICGLAAAGQVHQHRPHKHYQRKLHHHKGQELHHGSTSYSAAVVKYAEPAKTEGSAGMATGGGGDDKHVENVEEHHEKAMDKHAKKHAEKQMEKHGKRHTEKHSFEDHHDHEDIHHDYYSHPKYKFDYGVKDAKSGDDKNHWEERDGDKVTGSYTIKEADGTTRIVEYTADHHNGFQAVVKTLPAEEEKEEEDKEDSY